MNKEQIEKDFSNMLINEWERKFLLGVDFDRPTPKQHGVLRKILKKLSRAKDITIDKFGDPVKPKSEKQMIKDAMGYIYGELEKDRNINEVVYEASRKFYISVKKLKQKYYGGLAYKQKIELNDGYENAMAKE